MYDKRVPRVEVVSSNPVQLGTTSASLTSDVAHRHKDELSRNEFRIIQTTIQPCTFGQSTRLVCGVMLLIIAKLAQRLP